MTPTELSAVAFLFASGVFILSLILPPHEIKGSPFIIVLTAILASGGYLSIGALS